MVLIHFKKSDNNQFLHETSVETPTEDAIVDLSERNSDIVAQKA